MKTYVKNISILLVSLIRKYCNTCTYIGYKNPNESIFNKYSVDSWPPHLKSCFKIHIQESTDEAHVVFTCNFEIWSSRRNAYTDIAQYKAN